MADVISVFCHDKKIWGLRRVAVRFLSTLLAANFQEVAPAIFKAWWKKGHFTRYLGWGMRYGPVIPVY